MVRKQTASLNVACNGVPLVSQLRDFLHLLNEGRLVLIVLRPQPVVQVPLSLQLLLQLPDGLLQPQVLFSVLRLQRDSSLGHVQILSRLELNRVVVRLSHSILLEGVVQVLLEDLLYLLQGTLLAQSLQPRPLLQMLEFLLKEVQLFSVLVFQTLLH